MDIVIPLGAGSLHQNQELRFCLRSIQSFVKHDKIFIIGEKPEFLTGVTHIRAYDIQGPSAKERNIFRKILEAIYRDDVSEDFMFFNDDHFLLEPWAGEYFYHGTVCDKLAKKRVTEPYRITINNTLRVCPGLWYDVHCPIVYNKKKFLNSVGNLKWQTPWGFAIKSAYCNLNPVYSKEHADLKIGKPAPVADIWKMLENRRFFSSGNNISAQLMEVLHQLYPNKCKYEK
jgi:hypothetical protein